MHYSIRDAFLVTTIVALCIGWGLDRWSLAHQANASQASAELWKYRAGAVVDSISGNGWNIDWTPDGVNVSKPGAPIE